MRIFSNLITVCALSLLCACQGSVPPGRIQVLNTSLDQSYNVVKVYASGASYILKPGDSGLLPKGTTNITFSRRYENYTRTYQVQCPPTLKRGITLKLIDVHMNNMEGGCTTVSASKG